MLVGTVTSSPCEAVVARSNEDNMFQITPSATSVNSIQYENAFRMCFSDPSQGTASADYIAENGLASKIGIIYDSSDILHQVLLRLLSPRHRQKVWKLFPRRHSQAKVIQTSVYSCRKQRMPEQNCYSFRFITHRQRLFLLKQIQSDSNR